MANKEKAIEEGILKQRARQPDPSRRSRPEKPKKWQSVGVALLSSEKEAIDQITQSLKNSGLPIKRSVVMRAAILEFLDEVQGKSHKEIRDHFLERQTKRIEKL